MVQSEEEEEGGAQRLECLWRSHVGVGGRCGMQAASRQQARHSNDRQSREVRGKRKVYGGIARRRSGMPPPPPRRKLGQRVAGLSLYSHSRQRRDTPATFSIEASNAVVATQFFLALAGTAARASTAAKPQASFHMAGGVWVAVEHGYGNCQLAKRGTFPTRFAPPNLGLHRRIQYQAILKYVV